MSFDIVHLSSVHNRTHFECGEESLINYIKQQANQDIKRKLSVCFVAVDALNHVIAFYTLSNSGISKELIPVKLQKKFPNSYVTIPTTLLGRLAVDNQHKGQKLGEYMLIDALYKSYQVSKEIGSFAVIVDPINVAAKQFYTKYGFIELPDSRRMFLSMKTIALLFQ
jgi:predicted GNAT family N-acyltransferase